jgi:hypothetical protein
VGFSSSDPNLNCLAWWGVIPVAVRWKKLLCSTQKEGLRWGAYSGDAGRKLFEVAREVTFVIFNNEDLVATSGLAFYYSHPVFGLKGAVFFLSSGPGIYLPQCAARS